MERYFRNNRSFLNRYNIIMYDNGNIEYLLKRKNEKKDRDKLTSHDLLSWIDYVYSYFISAKIISVFGTNPIKLKKMLNVETKTVNRFEEYLFGPRNFSQSITYNLKQSIELSLKLMILIDCFNKDQVHIKSLKISHKLMELEKIDAFMEKYIIDIHGEDIQILKEFLEYLDNLDFEYASRYPHGITGHPKIKNQNQGAAYNQDVMEDFSTAFVMINHIIKQMAKKKKIEEIVNYIDQKEEILWKENK